MELSSGTGAVSAVEGDGVSSAIFELLWRANPNGSHFKGVLLPETMVMRYGIIVGWYVGNDPIRRMPRSRCRLEYVQQRIHNAIATGEWRGATAIMLMNPLGLEQPYDSMSWYSGAILHAAGRQSRGGSGAFPKLVDSRIRASTEPALLIAPAEATSNEGPEDHFSIARAAHRAYQQRTPLLLGISPSHGARSPPVLHIRTREQFRGFMSSLPIGSHCILQASPTTRSLSSSYRWWRLLLQGGAAVSLECIPPEGGGGGEHHDEAAADGRPPSGAAGGKDSRVRVKDDFPVCLEHGVRGRQEDRLQITERLVRAAVAVAEHVSAVSRGSIRISRLVADFAVDPDNLEDVWLLRVLSVRQRHPHSGVPQLRATRLLAAATEPRVGAGSHAAQVRESTAPTDRPITSGGTLRASRRALHTHACGALPERAQDWCLPRRPRTAPAPVGEQQAARALRAARRSARMRELPRIPVREIDPDAVQRGGGEEEKVDGDGYEDGDASSGVFGASGLVRAGKLLGQYPWLEVIGPRGSGGRIDGDRESESEKEGEMEMGKEGARKGENYKQKGQGLGGGREEGGRTRTQGILSLPKFMRAYNMQSLVAGSVQMPIVKRAFLARVLAGDHSTRSGKAGRSSDGRQMGSKGSYTCHQYPLASDESTGSKYYAGWSSTRPSSAGGASVVEAPVVPDGVAIPGATGAGRPSPQRYWGNQLTLGSKSVRPSGRYSAGTPRRSSRPSTAGAGTAVGTLFWGRGTGLRARGADAVMRGMQGTAVHDVTVVESSIFVGRSVRLGVGQGNAKPGRGSRRTGSG